MEITQPDYLQNVQHFHAWVHKSCVLGIRDPATGKEHPFLPYKRIESHFRDNNFRELDKILDALFDGDPPVDAENILGTCPIVFCILLSIGKGTFIQRFTQHVGLHDQRLPFDPEHGPADFPVSGADERFLQNFCEKQWMFCAKPFSRNLAGLRIPEDQVLPIIEMEELAGGGSAVVHKIVLHDEYNQLSKDTKLNPSERYANTFILKTYRTSRAEKYYNNEIEAFRRLRSNRASAPCIIGFHGSFMKGETYNVLLEYADQGTLEDYFRTQEPPTSGEDIHKFWNGLFQIIRALINVHEVPPLKSGDQGPQILRGWHQDVKPANILVVSQNYKSPYEWHFKLADLGLSHFRKVSSEDPSTDIDDIDAHGTRAYGAPEAYRPDDVIHEANLKILQNVDIWSLGCVYSEAAVWVAHGYKGQYGLEAYRHGRTQETEQLSNFKDGDCFHDGEKKLKIVGLYHERLSNHLRARDYVTKDVLDSMVAEMLDHTDYRPTAKHLWGKVLRINDKASTMLNCSNQNSSMEKAFSQKSIQLSQMPQAKKVPPVLPTNRPPTPQRSTRRTRKPAENITSDGSHSHQSSKSSPHIRSDSPESAGSEKSERFPQSARAKEKFVARNQSFPASTSQDSFYSEEKDTLAAFDEGSPPRIPAKQGRAHSRLSGTLESTQKPSLNSRHTEPESSRSNELRNHRPISFDQIRNSDFTNGTHLHNLPPRPIQQVQTTTQPLSSLSIYEAKRWKLERKQGRLLSRKHEQLEDFTLLNRLKGRDHVFLIDDSTSMAKHWTEVKEVCETLAYMVKETDPNGFDVYFTVTNQAHCNLKHTRRLEKIFEKKRPLGITDITLRLNDIFATFESNLVSDTQNTRFGRSKPPQLRPMNLYVLTNGLWDPHCQPEIPIKNLVQKLVQHGLHNHHFMIQFITFGTGDELNLAQIEHLDSGLNLELDIVDNVPSTGNVWKMLLGATHKGYDAENETLHYSHNIADDFTDATTLHGPSRASTYL